MQSFKEYVHSFKGLTLIRIIVMMVLIGLMMCTVKHQGEKFHSFTSNGQVNYMLLVISRPNESKLA